MNDWKLNDVVTGARGVHSGGRETPISGFSIDTRTIKKGEVYIALKGENHDGHAFIPKAIEQGASAIIAGSFPGGNPKPEDPAWIKVDDPLEALQNLARWHRKRHKAKFLGVTGSNGKTTTKEMLSHLFSTTNKVWATSGNLNNHIGLPLNLVRIPLDTQVAIMEMGMNHSGEIRFLAGISEPHSALISNIGPAHIGILGSLENIALAKGEILERLPPDGFAVLPGDDRFLALLKQRTTARVIRFGFEKENEIRGDNLRVEAHGMDLDLNYKGEKVALHLKLLGMHNASNAIAALAMFVASGNKLTDGARQMAAFMPVTARMESREIDGVRVIMDCYNANPASMNQAVEFLKCCPGRRIAVLGDMRELGDLSEELHRRLGKQVAESSLDQLVAVGDFARYISEDAVSAGMPPDAVHTCRDTKEAAKVIPGLLKKGDTILLKASRGIHFETIVNELWPGIKCELH